MFRLLSLLLVFACFFYVSPAKTADFETWLVDLKKEALQKGISKNIVEAALSDIKPISRIIELDRKQPEGTMTFARYKKRVISKARINQGRRLYREHRDDLQKAAQKYGVPAQYIVALWGIETSYGNNTGGFKVIPALATLAYDGRRSKFFRSELMEALKILDEGHIALPDMKGSWAGAMGQNQFMPSSFKTYAVDGDEDGKRDIWRSLPDVFSSTANYLSINGWKEEQRWGRAVKLPVEFPKSLTGRKIKKSLQDWKDMGITKNNGAPIPVVEGMKASVIMPDGRTGPAFLIYNNYHVIMSWNRSIYFATSVGLLADAIAQ